MRLIGRFRSIAYTVCIIQIPGNLNAKLGIINRRYSEEQFQGVWYYHIQI